MPFRVFSIASIFWFAFTEREKVQRADEVISDSMEKFNVLYHDLLERGIYLGPSGYEVGFISAAHTEEVLKHAAGEICSALKKVFAGTSTVRIS